LKKTITSYEDLDVYQKLLELHLEIHRLTLTFPKFEMYELGSQLRRSSNSIPANLAEAWSNKHINLYLEGINRSLGELRETRHHLHVAYRKSYLTKENYEQIIERYDESGRMLRGLEKALKGHKRWHHRMIGHPFTDHTSRPYSALDIGLAPNT
jgi:four helix bundle protein